MNVSNEITLGDANVDTVRMGNGDKIYGNGILKAWANFNGSGTLAIRASGNVSSVTDNGTGDYTVNFAVAMPDVNYAFSGGVNQDGSGWGTLLVPTSGTYSTTQARLRVVGYSTYFNPIHVSVAFFR